MASADSDSGEPESLSLLLTTPILILPCTVSRLRIRISSFFRSGFRSCFGVTPEKTLELDVNDVEEVNSRPSSRQSSPTSDPSFVNRIRPRGRDVGFFLPPPLGRLRGRKTLVLDLDETLVHSSFEPLSGHEIVFPVETSEGPRNVYVRKRPYVDLFLSEVSRMFEVIIFTASSRSYADPLLDILENGRGNFISHRLYRRDCRYVRGYYRKDLSLVGRKLSQTVIVDNSPICYGLQPENSIPIESWFSDPSDTELRDLLPWLQRLRDADDVYDLLMERRVYSACRCSHFERDVVLDHCVGDVFTQVLEDIALSQSEAAEKVELLSLRIRDDENDKNDVSTDEDNEVFVEEEREKETMGCCVLVCADYEEEDSESDELGA